MNILLLGGGGREDALAWRLSQSPSCEKLVVAPGNPGTERWDAMRADCAIEDPEAVLALAREVEADLVVVGPEAPLVAGVADTLRGAGIACFGPDAQAAQLEGSKAFTKQICDEANIPTAKWEKTGNRADALAALDRFSIPVVVKADGLAAGKGVVVAMTREEAEAAIEAMGDGPLVIEEYLEGEEASLFALVDGETVMLLSTAQDHKRVGTGDTGPNTGGMGAFSPAAAMTDTTIARVVETIVRPTAKAMVRAGATYRGVLYAGLMLTEDGPKLIEYNVRFGDPECEAIMPRIASDFASLLALVATGRLREVEYGDIAVEPAHVMTVVIAAENYPGTPKTGGTIKGIEEAEEGGAIVFQAGTKQDGDRLVASGGRVLAVTAAGETLREARDAVYAAVDKIIYEDGFHRRDIGARFIEDVEDDEEAGAQ